MNTKGKSIKSRIILGLCIMVTFVTTTASSCDDGSGPKLPNDLSSVPIVEGLGEACKVFGCGK